QIAERAVRLHVRDLVADHGGDRLQGADLVGDLFFEVREAGAPDHAAAKTPQIVEGGVSAYGDAVAFGELAGAVHDGGIARMPAASDAGRGDDAEHRLVVAHLPGAEAFTEVGIEIDAHDGSPSRPLSYRGLAPVSSRPRALLHAARSG